MDIHRKGDPPPAEALRWHATPHPDGKEHVPTTVVVGFFSPPQKTIWQGKAHSCMDSLYFFVHKSRPPLSVFALGLNIYVSRSVISVTPRCRLAAWLSVMFTITWTNRLIVAPSTHSYALPFLYLVSFRAGFHAYMC